MTAIRKVVGWPLVVFGIMLSLDSVRVMFRAFTTEAGVLAFFLGLGLLVFFGSITCVGLWLKNS